MEKKWGYLFISFPRLIAKGARKSIVASFIHVASRFFTNTTPGCTLSGCWVPGAVFQKALDIGIHNFYVLFSDNLY
jgi:hypothetical protein